MIQKQINTKKIIVAIGGGELKDLETLPIDREIKKLSGKKIPNVLFIPTASNDSIGYWETFKNVYGKKLKCKTSVLFLTKEKKQRTIKEKILSSDIIYVGGGNTLKMLKIWKQNMVDKFLIKAYKKGIILSGLSAGAICWFNYGLSDSRKFLKSKKQSFMKVKGLNLVKCIVSPHHIREKNKRDKGLKNLMKKSNGIALALDDNSALAIIDNTYKVIKSNKNSKIRKIFSEGKKIKDIKIKEQGSLETLLHKN